MVQVKAKYTNVPVQYDMRRSQLKQNAKQRNQPETNNTKKHQTNQTKQKQPTPTKQTKTTKEGATNTNQDNGQRGGQTRPNKTRARGEEGKPRPANKERADAGKAAEAGGRKQHKPRRRARAPFSGVLRGFWITRERIPQCRSEGHMHGAGFPCHHLIDASMAVKDSVQKGSWVLLASQRRA